MAVKRLWLSGGENNRNYVGKTWIQIYVWDERILAESYYVLMTVTI